MGHFQNSEGTKRGRDGETPEPWCVAGGNGKGVSSCRKQSCNSSNKKPWSGRLTQQSQARYLHKRNEKIHLPKKLVAHVHSIMILIAKKWKQPQWPSRDEQIHTNVDRPCNRVLPSHKKEGSTVATEHMIPLP